jgi:hypothetical protein
MPAHTGIYRRAPSRLAISITLIALIMLTVLSGRAAAASPWFVDGTLGNDANSCTAPGLSACQTIQAAINKASAGDTIQVAAGAYPESAPGPLHVDKTLILRGAQAGVDGRGRVAPESVISDSQGTWIDANNVVVDGFTVQDSTNGAFTGFGIWMGGRSGTQILNDIVQNNIIGIGLSNQTGGPQALIKHNQIQNNNNPGSASGTGIYTDQFVSLGAVKNVLITENRFLGNNSSGIDISNTDAANGVSFLEVSSNVFDGNGRGLILFNTHNSSVHDNSITNSTLAGGGAIRIFDNNSSLSIQHNDLIGGVGHAIRTSLDGMALQSSDVTINFNNIEFFALDGLLVDTGSHAGTLNAECNWWNSPTGPMNPSNPGGTGEEVVGDADFVPWLLAPAPGGACLGGVPSTPGKVTGGGQITGDPVFSDLGVLLSLPALVPSLADPSAQSTFGFVVTCCAPNGNLEYNDHSADVRIKAQSITGLFISSPGTACPATPGSQHAKFIGAASVIRSSGTSTEPFTVDVDDCGEPGTTDTFGIKTTTYSNGPTTLVGGNIQIHR